MRKCCGKHGPAGLLLFGLCVLLGRTAPTEVWADDEKVVFDMHEISIFDWAAGDAAYQKEGITAYYTLADSEPNEAIKKYPKLKSSRPMYGMVRFGESYFVPGVGQTYHFVLDESEGGQTREPEKPSLLGRLVR